MDDKPYMRLPLHPRVLAALPPEEWEHILRAVTRPLLPARGWGEVLNWERHPDRGVLHDPPETWYPVARAAYFAWRSRWVHDEEVPGLRARDVLIAWAEHVDMKAYAVNAGGRAPAAALLLWEIAGATRAPVAYIPDLIWDPEVDIRNPGRYLLQELYLHHPDALAVVDMVPASSPLNRVLMALGYRVYRRWQPHLLPDAGAGMSEEDEHPC